MLNIEAETLEDCLEILSSELGWKTIIQEVGGEKIDESSVGKGTRVADFLHHGWQLFFELKIIESSILDNDGAVDKIIESISDSKFRQVMTVDEIIKRKLENLIKSANDQIKSTKRHFSLNNYQGILILVNMGFCDMQFSDAVRVMSRIMKNSERYRSLNAIIYADGNREYIDSDLSITNISLLKRKSLNKFQFNQLEKFVNSVSIWINNAESFSFSKEERVKVANYIKSSNDKAGLRPDRENIF